MCIVRRKYFTVKNGGTLMRRFVTLIFVLLIVVAVNFMAACNGGGEPKKKADKSESDWSASSVVKDIEDMKKASERGKAPAQSEVAPKPVPQEAKK
jgi:hypothetical protein